jgi:osmotically-inducible protein OsmY
MNKFLLTSVLPIALILVAACEPRTQNATSQRAGISKHIEDSVITANVNAAIQQATPELPEITIETDKGVVQISGVIKSQDDIRNMSRAIELASRVEGVNYVKPDMRISKIR